MVHEALQLLNEAKDILTKQPEPEQFKAYPYYLKCKDVMDILQVSKSKARIVMHESGCLVQIGKCIRVERDKFFDHVQERYSA